MKSLEERFSYWSDSDNDDSDGTVALAPPIEMARN
jgi:hypothetical protein